MLSASLSFTSDHVNFAITAYPVNILLQVLNAHVENGGTQQSKKWKKIFETNPPS